MATTPQWVVLQNSMRIEFHLHTTLLFNIIRPISVLAALMADIIEFIISTAFCTWKGFSIGTIPVFSMLLKR